MKQISVVCPSHFDFPSDVRVPSTVIENEVKRKKEKQNHWKDRFPTNEPPYNMISNQFYFPCFHELRLDARLFEYLNLLAEEENNYNNNNNRDRDEEKERRKGIESIEHLTLYKSSNDYHYENVFPFLAKATKELKLDGWNVETLPPFLLSSSLEHLSLMNWKKKDLHLNAVAAPSLKKLTLEKTYVSNLIDFSSLNEVHLFSVAELSDTDLPSLNQVKTLHLQQCNNITDISCLQDNEEVSIRDCEKIVVYSHSFQNSIHIDIQYFTWKKVSIDVNLSHYTKVRSFSLRLSPTVQPRKWVTASAIPSHLKNIAVQSITGFNREDWFSTVQCIELNDCESIRNLVGLENVRKVILVDLVSLISLKGLGPSGNRFVKVLRCPKLEDLSPLNYIKVVKVIDCRRFYNGYNVNYVYDLTLSDCPNIVDIYMLHRVHHLILSNCSGITTIRGLEDVPRLEISNCPNIIPTKESIVGKDLGIRITSDRLTSLPDHLYPIILEFLFYGETKPLIYCNTYLFQLLFKRYNQIIVVNEEVIDFYTNDPYQKSVLAQVENPFNQLVMILESYILVDYFFRFNQCVFGNSEVHILEIAPDLFYNLLNRVPGIFPRIHTLKLLKINRLTTFETCEHLCRATDCLSLSYVDLPPLLTLSTTLKELEIRECYPAVRLTALPNLRMLKLYRTILLNSFAEFSSLIEMYLQSVAIDDVIPLKNIKSITLESCTGLQNIDALQTNQEVYFYQCEGFFEFRKAFSETKMITLACATDSMMPDIDISNYRKVEYLRIGGSNQNPQHNPLSTGAIPSTLKELQIIAMPYLDELGRGYGHLKSILISHCPEFSSVMGLGTVHTLIFNELHELKSLRGLGCGNQHVSIKNCPKIQSFAPLQKVPFVEIIDCESFTEASEMRKVKHLRIIRCKNLKDVKALGRIKDLELKGCSGLISTASLRNVRKLLIKEDDGKD